MKANPLLCLPLSRYFDISKLGLLIVLAVTATLSQPVEAELSQTIERVKPAVVGIGTFEKTRNPSVNFLGTGFVIKDGLHIVTNAHVVPNVLDTEKKETLVIITGTDQDAKTRPAQIFAVDRERDLMVLKIAGDPLPVLKLGDSTKVREGQTMAFTGFPIGMVLGFYPVTHRGIISSLTPIVRPSLNSKYLDAKMVARIRGNPYVVFQLDATAYPGNSGSPLYDPEDGTVYGIINMVFVKTTKEAVLSQPSGISYAIPINHVKELLR